MEWKDGSGESGLHKVVHIVARLLSPQVNDSAARKVGELVDKLVTVFGFVLASDLGLVEPLLLSPASS